MFESLTELIEKTHLGEDATTDDFCSRIPTRSRGKLKNNAYTPFQNHRH